MADPLWNHSASNHPEKPSVLIAAWSSMFWGESMFKQHRALLLINLVPIVRVPRSYGYLRLHRKVLDQGSVYWHPPL